MSDYLDGELGDRVGKELDRIGFEVCLSSDHPFTDLEIHFTNEKERPRFRDVARFRELAKGVDTSCYLLGEFVAIPATDLDLLLECLQELPNDYLSYPVPEEGTTHGNS